MDIPDSLVVSRARGTSVEGMDPRVVEVFEELRQSVRTLHLHVGELRVAISRSGLPVKSGALLLLESQQSVLQEVERELKNKPLTRRVEALAISTVGVLPSLFNAVQKAAKGQEMPILDQCRRSLDELCSRLNF